MAPRTVYANLQDGLQLLSLWDQSLADMGSLGIIPCMASGANAIALTPVVSANAPAPTYNANNQFSFIAATTSTGSVTVNVSGLGAKNVYKADGVTQVASGDIVSGRPYQIIYSALLNGAAGGFYLQATAVGELNASDITGGTLPAAQLPAGVPANVLNTVTANYTIAATDAGKTVQAGTGSTGLFMVTLPAVAGFATNAVVTVLNGDTARAKRLSGFPASTNAFLYPGQSITVEIVNGAWVVSGSPGRFKITAATTIYVNQSTGSDTNNDGLAVGSPKASIQAALYTVSNDFDFLSSTSSVPIVTIQQGANDTTGVHFGPQGLSGAVAGGSITWDGGGFSISSAGDTDDAIHLFFGTTIYLQNLTIIAGPTAHNGLLLEHGATAFIKAGVVFSGTNTNTAHMVVRDGASIEIDNNYSISGPGLFHAFCTNGGTIRASGAITATVTTPITVNTTLISTAGGVCDFSNVTFAGSAVTGTRFQANNAIILSKNGTPQTSIPGTINGTASNAGSADTVMSTTVAQGGTGVQAASGTALDNITGFATNGIIKRTGAGTYSQLADGQVPGTATNDNASAGNVGEFVSSEVLIGSEVTLTSTVAANVTSINLTAGDWDVYGNISYDPAGTTTLQSLIGWTSTTTAALPTRPNKGAMTEITAALTTGNPQTLPIGAQRLSLSGTTTVFLSTYTVFGTSTLKAYGFLEARRRR